MDCLVWCHTSLWTVSLFLIERDKIWNHDSTLFHLSPPYFLTFRVGDDYFLDMYNENVLGT
jgi:hypothetical protein